MIIVWDQKEVSGTPKSLQLYIFNNNGHRKFRSEESLAICINSVFLGKMNFFSHLHIHAIYHNFNIQQRQIMF